MLKKLFIIGILCISITSLLAQHNNTKQLLPKDTITDKELVVPEDIERNFDQLLVDWKLNFKPSSNCTSNYDNSFVYPDSVYINRLYSLPTLMELAYNPIVRSYIDMYTGRMKTSVEYFLGKARYYFPIFEGALDKYGLPLELKYLPIIESALNPTIVSRAGATGLWQFMVGTGKMYNLEINSLVDERRDPFASTDAAARYLKDLFGIYGDWNLVIAAYNCGPGNVNKAIRRAGGATDYWAIYPYLPKETRGYVPAFIAATYAMNYYALHNICPSEYKYTKSTDTITVDKYLHFQQLSEVLNIPIEQIRALNPQFKNDIIPGEYKQYVITLPSSNASAFEVEKETVYAYKADDLMHRKVVVPNTPITTTKKIRHKVRRGESLASIASRNGVTASQVKRWNRLKSNQVRVGQYLVIHQTITVKPQNNNTQSTPTSAYYANNTESVSENTSSVQNEDENVSKEEVVSSTLSDYFKKYSRSDQDLADTSVTQDFNDENTEALVASDETQTIYHKVRIGETIALIASKYNIDKKDIQKWNNLKSTVPKIGQRLIIHLPIKVVSAEDNKDYAEVESDSDDRSDKLSQYKEVAPIVDNTDFQPSRKEVESRKTTEISKNNKKKTTPINKKSTAVYTVKKGDTLGYIAGKFGSNVTVKDIIKYNNLKSNKLSIGQKLKIPR